MQFNLRDGPPSTWQTYRVDGDRDGDTDPYDPADAIASAAHYLRALLDARPTATSPRAVFGYNHSPAYVADVLARARAYSEPARGGADRAGDGADCAAAPTATCRRPGEPAAPPSAARRRAPTRMLPAWAMAGGRPAQPIDARLLDDALWLLRTYRLRVTAAREAGHNTHGDGTALDLVPAEPVDQAAWDALRRRARPRPRLDARVRRAPAAAPPARSCRRSSSSATTATPATARRAPAAAPAPRTCTSPGSRRATARARRRRRASGSPRSRSTRRLSDNEAEAARSQAATSGTTTQVICESWGRPQLSGGVAPSRGCGAGVAVHVPHDPCAESLTHVARASVRTAYAWTPVSARTTSATPARSTAAA